MPVFAQQRFFGFLEFELKFHQITLEWLSKNSNTVYEKLKLNFAAENGFEQAHDMHDGLSHSDNCYCVFYNYKKLDGNPLVFEFKDSYGIDDLFLLCHKTGYDFTEGVHYCYDTEIASSIIMKMEE